MQRRTHMSAAPRRPSRWCTGKHAGGRKKIVSFLKSWLFIHLSIYRFIYLFIYIFTPFFKVLGALKPPGLKVPLSCQRWSNLNVPLQGCSVPGAMCAAVSSSSLIIKSLSSLPGQTTLTRQQWMKDLGFLFKCGRTGKHLELNFSTATSLAKCINVLVN